MAASLSIGGGAILLSQSGSWCPGLLWHILPRLSHCDCNDLLFTQPLVGIGFDAGSVATGPLTTTFILALPRVRQVPFPARIFPVTGWDDCLGGHDGIITLTGLGVVFGVKSKARG